MKTKDTRTKVPDEKSDICVDMTRLLQKKAAYDNEFCGSSAETTQAAVYDRRPALIEHRYNLCRSVQKLEVRSDFEGPNSWLLTSSF